MNSMKQLSAFDVYMNKKKNLDSRLPFQRINKLDNLSSAKVSSKRFETMKRKQETKKVIRNKTKLMSCKHKNLKKQKENSSKKSVKYNISSEILECKVKPNEPPLKESLGSAKTDMDPIKEGEELFKWLIYPLKEDEFFKINWEKAPVHIKRNKTKYYRSLMSTPMLDKILRENHILFTKNLDITSFTNDVRETHNPPGRALPSIVWDYFLNGCSVRMLNPQTYIPKLHLLNATLQEYFGCLVGANSYLTPPNSQGFAPHYDDIEAFVLQIEGQKRWRLYRPRNINEFLPRYSSANLSQKELDEPILDTIVNAGDLLYFPRGTIHQGDTIGFEKHSLHITLSVYQKNSWGDFLEKLMPVALKDAITNDVRFREGLPLNYLRHTGLAYSDNVNDSYRQHIIEKTMNLLRILVTKYVNIDKAADDMAKSHIHDFLPPVLNENESICSVYESGERMIDDGVVINQVEIEPDSLVRLSRAHCVRLIEEDDSYRLYYSSDNSKEYHEFELQYLEVDKESVPVIQRLITKFPEYVRVEDLPMKELDKKIQIVSDLWEKAIVISKEPLPIVEY